MKFPRTRAFMRKNFIHEVGDDDDIPGMAAYAGAALVFVIVTVGLAIAWGLQGSTLTHGDKVSLILGAGLAFLYAFGSLTYVAWIGLREYRWAPPLWLAQVEPLAGEPAIGEHFVNKLQWADPVTGI